MQTQNDELKKRARLARQRLKMGYWDACAEEKRKVINAVGSTETRLANELVREKIKRETNESVYSQKDEALYKKVCVMLEGDEVVLNPIGRLVDHKEYDNLDDAGRQRYILELSSKFRELQARYEKERRGKII